MPIDPQHENPTMSEDRSSSIEKAIAVGYAYAEEHRHDRLRLGRIARAQSASEVTANLDGEIATDGSGNSVAFWSGFAHGVGWNLLNEAHGVGRSALRAITSSGLAPKTGATLGQQDRPRSAETDDSGSRAKPPKQGKNLGYAEAGRDRRRDLKSRGPRAVRVQVPPPALRSG